MVALNAAISAAARSRGMPGGAANGRAISCAARMSFRICSFSVSLVRSMTSGTLPISGSFLNDACTRRLIFFSFSHARWRVWIVLQDRPHRPSTSPRSIASVISLVPG